MGKHAKIRQRTVATGAAGIGLMLTTMQAAQAGPVVREDTAGPATTETVTVSATTTTYGVPTSPTATMTPPATTTQGTATPTATLPTATPPPAKASGLVVNGITIPDGFAAVYQANATALGKPIAPVQTVASGYLQRFERGGITGADTSAATANDTFRLSDGFFTFWYAHQSWLGAPKGVDGWVRGEGRVQHFTKGAIFWNKNQARFISVNGNFYLHWQASGGSAGLWWPAGEATGIGANIVQRFLNGQGIVHGLKTGTIQRFDARLMRAADARSAFTAYGGLKGRITSGRCATLVAPFEKGSVVARTDSRWCPAPAYAQPTTKMTPVPSGYTVSRGWGSGKVNAISLKLGLGWEYNNYGYRQQNAVIAFQKRVGLPATGVVDKATWDKLGTGWSWWVDGWQTPVVSPVNATREQHVEQMIAFAQQQVGAKYIFGGTGPAALGYACSGIVYQAMISAGVDPYPMTWVHTAAPNSWGNQALYKNWTRWQHVPSSQMKRGDLVFWDWNRDGATEHVGIYLGGGMILDSIYSAGVRNGVKVVPLRSTYFNMPMAPYVVRPFADNVL